MTKDSNTGNRLHRFSRVCKRFDIFGEKKEFNIGNSSTYNSISGSVITIFIATLLIAFTVNKTQTLYKREDYQIYETLKKNNLDRTRVFSQNETNFFAAFFVQNAATG